MASTRAAYKILDQTKTLTKESNIGQVLVVHPKGKSSKTDIVQRNESWRISGGKEEKNSRYLEYFRTISYATAS
jgi:hypothetical protein